MAKDKSFTTKNIILGAGILLALVLISGFAYFKSHSGNKMANAPQTQTAGQLTKGESQPSSTSQSSTGQTTQPGDDKSTTGGGNDTTTLIAPSGNFVSNHEPNLSGSPAPNELASVCNTTSGATCQIAFTKDGVTKALPEQVTDRGGSTYWTWKLQDIGLTAGTWSITAKATLNNQMKTTNDALNLAVSP